MTLAGIDLAIVAGYALLTLGIGVLAGRSQRTEEDYYVGGRRVSSGAIACSMLATQVSAVSLVGAPAFIAVREGGGLTWLQYELAVPLAMIAIAALILPALVRARVVTIYEYVGRRFGPLARSALAAVFVLARGLATGVSLYATAVVLAPTIGLGVAESMVLVALVAIIYTTVGGIRADIYSDVAQLVVLVLGTAAVAAVLVRLLGGWPATFGSVDAARLEALDVAHHGLGDGRTFSLWPMLIGGLFLYVSYYGCDQSQTQRLLAADGLVSARRALLLNGVFRLPLALGYCLVGLLLAEWLGRGSPEARAIADAARAKPDLLFPSFLSVHVPEGLRGLIVAGLLAAAMSSLDSAFNAMSAVTLRDLLRRDPESGGIGLARALTVGWGVLTTAAGLGFARSSETVIEVINRVGSMFYGPILALFLLGTLAPRVGERGAVAGLLAGIAANGLLSAFFPRVSWLWWNPAGCLVAVAVGLGHARGLPEDVRARVEPPEAAGQPGPLASYVALAVVSAAALALMASLPSLLRG